MNNETLARATFVLSKSAFRDLAYLSERMGQSRSALVRDVLEQPIAEMAALLRRVPAKPTGDDLDLFRDEARKLVDGHVAAVDREIGHG